LRQTKLALRKTETCKNLDFVSDANQKWLKKLHPKHNLMTIRF